MSINEGSILAKVNAYAESARGKRRMKQVIADAAKAGGKLPSGRAVLDEMDIAFAVTDFLSLLREAARELPDSVYAHIDGAYEGEPVWTARGCEVPIYFKGNLSRESLEDGMGGRTGEGVDNIVAVFNNGAHARATVYGWWNGHSPKWQSGSLAGGDGFVWVPSKQHREGTHFIQRAVKAFNNGWGKDHGVHISDMDIAEIYKR